MPEPIQALTQRRLHPVGSVRAAVTHNRRRFISRRIDPIRIALLLALCLGPAFCIVRFLHRPSLWLDEAMLADNIVARSFWELTQPLDYLQLAPIMFLWVERLMVTLLGANEWALRLFPLLSAIALPPLAFIVAQKLVPRHCAVIAPLALAVSPAIIHFAIETKPYASDALMGLTLLALATAVLEPRSSSDSNPAFRNTRWPLALVGAAAPWIAFTSIFFLGAIALVLLAPRFRVSSERLTKSFSLGIASVWLVSSIAAVSVSSDESIVRGMHFYWKDNFLTTDLGAVFQISHIAGNLIRLSIFGGTGAQSGAMSPLMLAAALLILLLGVVDLWRRRPAYFVLLCGPLLAAFLAFALKRYPFADRLWLFAAPVLVLVFVVGIHVLVRRFPPRFQTASALSIGAAFVLPAFLTSLHESYAPGSSAYERHLPYYSGFREQARPLFADLLRNVRAGDAVYIFPRAAPAWLFYATNWRAERGIVRSILRASPPAGPAFLNGGARGVLTLETERILTRARRGHVEIIGVSSGHPAEGERPFDPIWSRVEVQRIVRSRARCAMLFFEGGVLAQYETLTRELQSVGALELSQVKKGEGITSRYCWPYDSSNLSHRTPHHDLQ